VVSQFGRFALSTGFAQTVAGMALYLDTTIQTARVPLRAARACIKSDTFDLGLLILPLATGLASAAAVLSNPALFAVLLLADLWLLGYHHVVATYTRLAFGKDAFRRNRFLAFDLLLLMTAATMGLAFTAGAWVVATTFLYLQWFHYMRQGYGLSRMYFRATPEGQVTGSRDITTDLVVYLVPIYAIAARSATMGSTFLEFPVKVLVLPSEAITALGFAATVAGVMWAVRSAVAFTRGTLDPLYTGFVLSHIAIFLVAYIAIEDVNTGWLAINVWHNFQYVLVVWMMNAKKYAGGIDPAARFLSRISQPGRVATYFLSCIAISTIIYLSLGSAVSAMGGGVALTVGIYMGINFHHYIVDALIWKRRRVVSA
jgi:hypothetical protein